MIKIIPIQHSGSGALVDINKVVVNGKQQLFVMFQKQKYIYNDSTRLFEKLTFPNKMGFSVADFKSAQGLTNQQVDEALEKYGPNIFDIPLPSFQELFKEQAVAPFFIFQLFCVSLWFLDDMWYYSLFTVFMLVVFESTVVFQRLKSLNEFRSMSAKPYSIYVFRSNNWLQIQSDNLVPGDICSVLRSQDEDGSPVPCDMLIIQGSCIANEAMLSGESTPQLKESIWSLEDKDIFNINEHKGNVLFGGTKVLQVTPPKYLKTSQDESLFVNQNIPAAPDNGCIASVLKTGFSSQQGKLVRMIVFSTERVTANNMEALLFILFLMFFAIIAASYVWNEGINNPKRKQHKVLLDCILIITSVVPPELPMELSLAVNNSLLALSKSYIFCTEPFRIPFAGKVDIACFDKTGTLTVEDLIVEGVCFNDSHTLVQVVDVGRESSMVLATAHALVFLENNNGEGPKTSIIGDPMEKNTLDAINWELLKGDIVSGKKLGKKIQIKILRRYPFSSSLKRMSTICQVTESGTILPSLFVSVKGAPETIHSMISSPPDNYNSIYKYWARRGSRVLALAYKNINTKLSSIHSLTRDVVECDLIFAGFLVFNCPLKPDSINSVRELNESSHRVVMITGDNALTAAHVAKQVEIVKRDVLIGDVWEDCDDFEWRSVDEKISFKADFNSGTFDSNLKGYDLCITGRGLDKVLNTPAWAGYLLPRIWVYARVSPGQKESILTAMKEAGFQTLMCGDGTFATNLGTNDVGALKQSHVGIALLDGNEQDLEKLAERQRIKRQQQILDAQTKMREKWVGDVTGNPQIDAQKRKEREIKMKLDEMMNDLGDEAPALKFGDASVAAPFTSKISSIKSVCIIVRQGRSTLVAMIQMYKILALNCLISAYSMSVMYLAGIKQGDWQATIAGLMITSCFFGIAKSTAIDRLSKKRPQANIFNLYIILSVLGQAAVHVAALSYIRHEAINYSVEMEEEFDLDSKFQPNILNSGVYLVSLIMQISTFAINYQGLPFRESIFKNKALYYSLGATSAIAILAATEMFSELNDSMQLVPFPYEFKVKLISTMLLDYGIAWLVELLCAFAFSDNRPKAALVLD